jgi:hypothetical protein
MMVGCESDWEPAQSHAPVDILGNAVSELERDPACIHPRPRPDGRQTYLCERFWSNSEVLVRPSAIHSMLWCATRSALHNDL